MKKIWDKFFDSVLPCAIGVLWLITIVALSSGMAIWSIKWLFRLVGVL